jgi:hypothetical protein
MPSFAQMNDLPPVLDTTGWRWERYQPSSSAPRDFWLGFDLAGRRWLTKLRGDLYAYRELVFSRLAQKMGWSCQSSAFMVLDPHSAQQLGVPDDEGHAAHWFMDEHPRKKCSSECPLAFLRGRPIETVDDLAGSRIDHILDWPKSEIAACLFGGNESPGCLITTAHEFVIIDSEQMFSSGRSDLTETRWWNNPGGSPSVSGRWLTCEVCRDLCRLSQPELKEALRIPDTVSVRQRGPVARKLNASRAFARRFLVAHERARVSGDSARRAPSGRGWRARLREARGVPRRRRVRVQ